MGIYQILTNRLATQVRFCDLEDDMILARLAAITESDLERLRRYHPAHQRLLEVLPRPNKGE